MNAMLVTKPIAALLSVTAIATLLLGGQLALSQVSTDGQEVPALQVGILNRKVTIHLEKSL